MKVLRHSHPPGRAFTLIEVLLAIAIFAMVMTAIYSSWSMILRGTRIGLTAAAEAQRTRVTINAIEDAFGGAIMYADNARYYWILADTSGQFAGISFVARLPRSFPGSGLFPGQPVRRVTFMVEEGYLKLHQSPLLEDPEASPQPYTINLAPNVNTFEMEFLDIRRREWLPEWASTNRLPYMVRVAIGLGKEVREPVLRVIPVHAVPITRIGGGAPPNQPGNVAPPLQ